MRLPSSLLVSSTLLILLSTGCVDDLPTTTDETGSSGADEPGATTDALPPVFTTTFDPDATTGDAPPVVGCTPGAAQTCAYEGPPGTAGVGVCVPATRVCGDDGRWGRCAGEVVPTAEDCHTVADENCDGHAQCTGEVVWARSFGEPDGGASGDAEVRAVAVDRRGRAWISGQFTQTLLLGAEVWAHADTTHFVARVGAGGQVGFGFADLRPGAMGSGSAVAVGPDGQVALAANVLKDLQLAAQAPIFTVPDGSTGSAFARLDDAGAHLWSRWLTPIGQGSVEVRSLAFDAEGDLWVAAALATSDANVGSTGMPHVVKNHGYYDAVLLEVTPDGELARALRYGDTEGQLLRDIAVDAAGDVWLVGEFTGILEIDGHYLDAKVGEGESADMFVVKLDGEGRWRWGRSYGDVNYQTFADIVVDDAGAVVLGEHNGQVVFLGDHPLVNPADEAVVVARYDPEGEVVWARTWPCTGDCSPRGLAGDGAGQTVVAVALTHPGAAVRIDGQTFVGGERPVTALTKLDRAGEAVWSPRALPADLEVAAGPGGEVVVAGSFRGAVSFADGEAFALDAGPDADADIVVAGLRP